MKKELPSGHLKSVRTLMGKDDSMAEANFKGSTRRRLLKGVGAIFAAGLAEGGFSGFNGQENPKQTVPKSKASSVAGKKSPPTALQL